MTEPKPKITLIGTRLAKIDLEFVYKGELPDCENCKVRKVCNNLQTDKRYRIIGVRNSTVHNCDVHEEGVVAVEVVESPIVTLINAERAIVNSKILFESTCTYEECKSHDLCNPEGIISGEHYIIGEILGNAPEGCEKGKILKLVELRPA